MQKTLTDRDNSISATGRKDARLSAQQNSRRVRNLKIILPVACLLIIVGMFALYYRFDPLPGLDFESTSISTKGLVMTEPKLSGSNSGNSFNVVATRAIQRLTQPHIIDLEKINAEIVQAGGESLTFSANTGIFNSDDDSLLLNESIKVQWNSGYSVSLESAEVNLKMGIIKSDNQILVEASGSQLSAGKVEYLEDEKSVKFSDGVSMTINPSASGDEK